MISKLSYVEDTELQEAVMEMKLEKKDKCLVSISVKVGPMPIGQHVDKEGLGEHKGSKQGSRG